MRRANIEVPKEHIVEFCRQHRIRRLSLFGSVLQEKAGYKLTQGSGELPGLGCKSAR
jgi:hypothetical protein